MRALAVASLNSSSPVSSHQSEGGLTPPVYKYSAVTTCISAKKHCCTYDEIHPSEAILCASTSTCARASPSTISVNASLP